MSVSFVSGRNFCKYNKTHINLSRRLWLVALKSRRFRNLNVQKERVNFDIFFLWFKILKGMLGKSLYSIPGRIPAFHKGLASPETSCNTGGQLRFRNWLCSWGGENKKIRECVCFGGRSLVGGHVLWKHLGLETWLADGCDVSAQIPWEGTFPQCCSYPSGRS